MIPRTSPSIRSFHKGKVIFSEGQESKVAYLVKTGTVDIYRKVEEQKTVLATLRRGDIFGEMALLTDQKRTAYAEASSFCELVVLTDELMQKLLEASPSTVKKIVELLAKRVVATDGKSCGSEQSDSFIALATMLNLAYREYLYTPRNMQSMIENYNLGLAVKSFEKTVKGLTMFSNLEIGAFLDMVYKLRLIDLRSPKKGDKNVFPERYISIKNIQEFLPSLRNLYKQMKEIGASVESRMSYMSFTDLAQKTGTSPNLIYKKVIKEEMPETLLFFNRKKSIEWSKDKDDGFFRKFKRPRKSLKDLENAEDLIYIDNNSLAAALKELDFYKISVIYSAGDKQNKDKIKRNLGRKMAGILLSDPPRERSMTDPEVLECCDELFDSVRKLKGAA